jgi:hypothetical protein
MAVQVLLDRLGFQTKSSDPLGIRSFDLPFTKTDKSYLLMRKVLSRQFTLTIVPF